MVPKLQRCNAFPGVGAWQGQGRGRQ